MTSPDSSVGDTEYVLNSEDELMDHFRVAGDPSKATTVTFDENFFQRFGDCLASHALFDVDEDGRELSTQYARTSAAFVDAAIIWTAVQSLFVEDETSPPEPDDSETPKSQRGVVDQLRYLDTQEPEPEIITLFDSLMRCLHASEECSKHPGGTIVEALNRCESPSARAELLAHHVSQSMLLTTDEFSTFYNAMKPRLNPWDEAVTRSDASWSHLGKTDAVEWLRINMDKTCKRMEQNREVYDQAVRALRAGSEKKKDDVEMTDA